MPQADRRLLASTIASRDPYVIKACDECRRRKIRCSGVRPCRRCDRLSLACVYRAKRQHNSHPEQEPRLQSILNELSDLRAEYEALAATSGHTSNSSASPPPLPNTGRNDLRSRLDTFSDAHPRDPLTYISSEEVNRLLHVYDEHLQFFYPLADLDAVRATGASLDQIRDFSRAEDALDEADAVCLRLVLANAMAVDDGGHGDLPSRLYDSVCPYLSGLPNSERLDVKALRAIVLVAQYFFIRDQIVTAWRNIGFAVRTMVELGLHLQRNVDRMFPDSAQRRQMEQLFWSIYILDHCWSLHWGLGPAAKVEDPRVGVTPPDDSMPFLRAMVDCTAIISRAWKVICPSMNEIDGIGLREAQQRLEGVYRELREWQSSAAVSEYFYKQQSAFKWWQCRCLRTWLYLRANELCIFLCKPILVTRNSLAENRGTLEFATTLAKDSISVLVEFNRSCSCMRVLPFVFNQFLSSALATLCLASIHEPFRFNTRAGDCRAPIFAAKDLIEEVEHGSFIHRRLYDTSREIFALISTCRIHGKVVERDDEHPAPASEDEFYFALKVIEPLFGRIGHES